MFDPSGSSTLDSFGDIWICEWTPNCGAVLWLRTNKNVVGRRFKRFGVNLDVSPKCIVCLFRDTSYVHIPWQVWRDLVMWMTWHLEGLNSMSQLWLKRSRLSRSFWRISDWDIYRYTVARYTLLNQIVTISLDVQSNLASIFNFIVKKY